MDLKVLIADKFPEQYADAIRELGLEIISEPKLGEQDLVDAAKEVDVLIVRSTKVNEQAIANAKNLKFIIRAGAGVNNIKTEAAKEAGIWVANCPGTNSIAVAELAVGLMLSLDRRIPDNVNDFNKGVWNKGEYSKAEGIYGKKLGLVGVGHIGKEVAKRALALGMKVYGNDIMPVEGVDIEMVENVETMLAECDVISLHLPVNDKTKGMFNADMFSKMKDGAFFINTARDGVVDQAALIEAVKTKGLRVGVDVFDGEPEQKEGDVTSELQSLPGVYVTHHIGASTNQAQNAVAAEVVRIIKAYLNTKEVINCVNK